MNVCRRNTSLLFLLLLSGAPACRTGPPPPPRAPLPVSRPDAVQNVAPGEPGESGESGEFRSDAEPGPGLDDYVRRALAANPALEAARQHWLAELERLPQVSSLPDPVVAARYYIEEVETRVGPQQWGLGVRQTFPWLGKRGRLEDEAAARAEAARAEYDGWRLTTIEEVRTGWYELYYLERSIAVVRENRELLLHLEEVVRTRYSSGDATYADLIRAQVERDRLGDRLASLEDQRRPFQARLNRAVHRTPSALVSATPTLPPTGVVRPIEDLQRELEETNPELRALRDRRQAAHLGIELAELAQRPDLTFGIEYIATGSAEAPNIAGSGDDPVIATLSFNVPLWSARNRARKREARARQRVVVSSLESAHDDLLTELEAELFRARDAERQVGLYRDALLPKARQAVQATETAFRSGAAGFLDLVDAERLQLEFELNLERARTDRALAIARLERLVGGPVTDGVAPTEEDL